ncbi:MAG: HD domain-containing protein [Opitutaceae bacterium]|nr:HD domain-containing protein [Opitutaceae bacterium]
MPETPVLTVQQLKALESAAPFSSVLLVRKVTARVTSGDRPYLVVELSDRTGSFSANAWSDTPVFDFFKSLTGDVIVRVEGRIDYYQNRLSPRLNSVTALSEAEINRPEIIENIVETPPEDAEALWREFQGFIAGIQHAELRATTQAVFDEIGDAFRVSPAAISMHHAYRHGLIEHTVHMARACRALLPLYPEVDPDLATTGVLLHDTGKVIEYEGTLAPQRSRKGLLQGHVVLGYQLVRKAGLKVKLNADLLERLEHIILSHQGELAYGAATMAATPEAVFVSMLDNLDARMGMVQRALRQAGGDGEFSDKIPGLNAQLLTRPPAK